jgi:hypothetical protein
MIRHLFICFSVCLSTALTAWAQDKAVEGLNIGWASADLTPAKPVLIAGQFHARVSEGVMDPITATVLAIESVKGHGREQAIMVSCDFVSVSDGMRDPSDLRGRVREIVNALSPEIKTENIMLNATHSHSAPYVTEMPVEEIYGVSLEMMSPDNEVMAPADYSEFAAQKIAEAIVSAWNGRKRGGISFGLSKAVTGHNRLQALKDGRSLMYGNTNSQEFSHMEGYENHDLNLLFTWNEEERLTGVVVNTAVPSQVSEQSYLLSGDFWNETRHLFKERFGETVHVLGQVSAAGDQSPHLMWGSKAEERMQRLMGMAGDDAVSGALGRRRMIALHLANGTEAILPYMKANIEWDPAFGHRSGSIQLSRRLLGEQDLIDARKAIETFKPVYEKLLAEAKANPEATKEPRWYANLTVNHAHYKRGLSVLARYEIEQKQPKMPVEVQVLRIGDMVIASNPFELYLDYGVRMLAKSPAVQTFVVQLAGSGTYLPTRRSIAGGAYGAVPASTIFGPEGGDELVEYTLELIHSLWKFQGQQ